MQTCNVQNLPVKIISEWSYFVMTKWQNTINTTEKIRLLQTENLLLKTKKNCLKIGSVELLKQRYEQKM